MLKHAPKEMAWEHTVMKPTLRKLLRWALLLAVLVCITATPVTSQTYTTLHHFNYGSDGGTPWAELVLSGDTLYGTTASGGSSAHGTVYKVKTDGSGFTVLHNFNFGTDGGYPGGEPRGGLVLAGDTLYGTTVNGGSSGYGSVFKINTDGTGFATLHNFGFADANPYAGLALSGSVLYGTTVGGSGPGQGGSSYGTIFRIGTDGTGYATLHSFSVPTSPDFSVGINADGTRPFGGLRLAGGVLYGTALAGGAGAHGTVFKINTDGSDFTTLYSFSAFGVGSANNDGSNPQGRLVLAGDTLYGTAYRGGTGSSGTVFAVNTDGSGFIALHHFTYGSDGGEPRAGLVLSGTTLYGTASHAGSQSNGTVFKVDTGGTEFATLHTFTGLGGQTPEAGLILAGNTLYGAAYAGGSGGNGTVYSLTLAAAAPRLAIARDGANVVLAWPVADAGFTLESTTDLTAPAAWTTVTPAPSEVAGKNTVTKPVTGTQIFYRLSQ